MIKFKFDINEFKNSTLFKRPLIIRQGFESSNDWLREFYEILFNPLNGSHQSFGENRSLVKMMDNTTPVDPSLWTHSFPGDQGKYRDFEAVKKAIELKCSMVFDEYYRYSDETKELVAFIQEQFNCTSGCNAYLSQIGGCAFPVHRDCHHVFILSLAGEKRWKIYNATQPMNLAYNRVETTLTNEQIIESGLYYDEIMQPGDILYIPIGQFHSVENLSDNALHLTVSMSFKPLFVILEEILAKIYAGNGQLSLSDRSKTILNEIHPIYHSKGRLKKEDIIKAVESLSILICELAEQDDFIEASNSVKKNQHLNVFVKPTSHFIESLIK